MIHSRTYKALFSLILIVQLILVAPPTVYAQPEDISKNPIADQLKRKVESASNNWKKQQKKNPKKAAKSAKAFEKELDKFTRFTTPLVKGYVYALYSAAASKVLPKEDWCKLYKKLRGDKTSPFNKSKDKRWKLSDDYHKQVCLKEKIKGSEQAFKSCEESEHKIGELAKNDNYAIELIGDGTTTDQSLLVVTNKTTGAFGSSIVKTMCSSTRLHKPPPPRNIGQEKGLTFSVKTPNRQHVAVIKAAEKLSKEGKYQKLGLPNAKSQIAQNAIWKLEADKTGKPEHQVTNATIKKRILKQVDKELTPEVDKALTQRVDEILATVNLTIKESKPLIEDPPKKKKPDTVTPPPVTEPGDGTIVGKDPDETIDESYCVPPFTCFDPSDDTDPDKAADTTITAVLYEKQGHLWVKTNHTKIITFKFDKCSSEPGECLNAGMQKKQDLKFDPKNKNNANLICRMVDASTKNPVTKFKAGITTEDFGSYSQLSATAPGCVPLKNIGGNIQEAKDNAISLPKDDNNNQIADQFEKNRGQQPKATDDEDDKPKGNSCKGDGLSAYEEYRGFRVKKVHTRTSWKNKDLFILDKLGKGFKKFEDASEISCHAIKDKTEWKNRVINFNHKHAHLVDQHGVKIINASVQGASGQSKIGPPRNVTTHVKIDVSDHREIAKLCKENNISNFLLVDDTIAHELGHATGLEHHGEGYGQLLFLDDKNNPTAGKKDDIDFQNSRLRRNFEDPPSNDDLQSLTVYGEADPNDFPFRLPQPTLKLRSKGNASSGDVSCYMRYINNWNDVYQTNGKYEHSGEPYKVAPLTHFCSSKAGTGINAGGKCAGDASAGKCKKQFVVNDNCQSNEEKKKAKEKAAKAAAKAAAKGNEETTGKIKKGKGGKRK